MHAPTPVHVTRAGTLHRVTERIACATVFNDPAMQARQPHSVFGGFKKNYLRLRRMSFLCQKLSIVEDNPHITRHNNFFFYCILSVVASTN